MKWTVGEPLVELLVERRVRVDVLTKQMQRICLIRFSVLREGRSQNRSSLSQDSSRKHDFLANIANRLDQSRFPFGFKLLVI
jgi:hypothetical protein